MCSKIHTQTQSSEHPRIKSHEIFPLLTNNTPVLQIHTKLITLLHQDTVHRREEEEE